MRLSDTHGIRVRKKKQDGVKTSLEISNQSDKLTVKSEKYIRIRQFSICAKHSSEGWQCNRPGDSLTRTTMKRAELLSAECRREFKDNTPNKHSSSDYCYPQQHIRCDPLLFVCFTLFFAACLLVVFVFGISLTTRR